MSDESAARLKLAQKRETVAPHNKSLLSSGVEIECNLHEIEHPEGRFRRADGTRYDICVMETMMDPTLRPPSISRASFVGDGADTQSAVIRLGNVRMSSFRLYLISPGEAFGAVSADGKAATASTQ
ncbi:MAG TPA: hypothetical protein VGI60_07605 [Chthoniobacterales bacterium]|jgi:hypothetical protein